ncbi:Sec translocon accessory complex subunit YajC [Clostridiales bacterium]|nr:Sec translocon accessory complex subunit YajC [Clostridiales bacterium]
MLNYFLADVNTVVSSGNAGSSAAAASSSSTGGGLGMSWIFIYIIVIFAAMYFMSIRPQKKRQREMEEMRSKIKPGDSVLCNTGMYGRVVDITAECYIIEFGMNKGVRVPVLKSEVAYVKEPNLSNKEAAPVEEEKRGLFGFGKKKSATPSEEVKSETTTADKVENNIES